MFDDEEDSSHYDGPIPEDATEFYVYGIIPSDNTMDSYSMILRDKSENGKMVSITIGSAEAQAIAIFLESGQENQEEIRPLTHDVFAEFIDQCQRRLNYVIIDGLEGSTVFSTMSFDGDTFLDCRPSDSISMSIRFSAPIFIANEVIKAISFENHVKGMKEEPLKEKEPEPKKKRATKKEKMAEEKGANRKSITDQLNDAIAKEDYETAAKLRDLLSNLDI